MGGVSEGVLCGRLLNGELRIGGPPTMWFEVAIGFCRYFDVVEKPTRTKIQYCEDQER